MTRRNTSATDGVRMVIEDATAHRAPPGRAVVMFGNLTNYPVEHLTEAVLASGAGRRALPGGE